MKAKKTVYGSMKKGGKMYKNGGKTENLPEGKMDPKERANEVARAKRRAAIKAARKEGREKAGRKGEGRVQKTMARTPFTSQTEFGPESLRRGKRRRISRRLERTAEKAGVAKDKAYSTKAALAAEVGADDAKDEKAKKKAQRLQRLQSKYRGEKTVTTIGKKKNKKRPAPAGGTANPGVARGGADRPGLLSGDLPELYRRTLKSYLPGAPKVLKHANRPVNKAINRLVNESRKRKAARQASRGKNR